MAALPELIDLILYRPLWLGKGTIAPASLGHRAVSEINMLGGGQALFLTHLPLLIPPSLSLSLFSLSLCLSLSLSTRLSPASSVVADSQYKYGNQLLELEACSLDRKEALPDYLCQVVMPLKLEAWQEAMSDHPDQAFAAHILCGIEKGFRIGFNPHLVKLKSSGANMSSAAE